MPYLSALRESRFKQPEGERSKGGLDWPVTIAPPIGFARRMDRGRDDDDPAVAAQVESRCETDPVANLEAGMCEVQVPAAAAGEGLDGIWQGAMALLKPCQRQITAVPAVDIQY